jgi:hypothetical protein
VRLQLRDHGGRKFDAVHTDPPPTEWQRDATRTDAELERVAVTCQMGEELHSRVERRRIEQLGPQGLVPLR